MFYHIILFDCCIWFLFIFQDDLLFCNSEMRIKSVYKAFLKAPALPKTSNF